MFSQDTRGEQRRLLGIGDDGIYADAWGRQKVITDFSQFHGIFTFNVPNKLWLEYTDGVEVAKTNCTSVNGELLVESNGGSTYLKSRRHPRYQPNRGMIYSTSVFLDNATTTNGKLYAVVRTYRDSTVIEDRQEIDISEISGFDPVKGNIYDIQMQWRGVGNIKFFINQKEVCIFDYLGKRDNVTVSNPALPIGYEANTDGELRFGSFSPQFGIFFEWVFDTPAECSLRCGCVDMTSEGGTDEKQQFVAAISNPITVSDSPILAVRIPETFNGQLNTRDIQLSRIKISVSKKSQATVYLTRDTTCLTLTGISWVPVNGGNIEALTPASSTELSMDKNKAQLIDGVPCQVNVNNVADSPNINKIDFYLVHGDILILNGEGATVEMQAGIHLGEEI